MKKENKGLVSVIMPVYNGLPMICASIDSLLKQTYFNWECIIVNDGSTDGTKDFLDTLNDSRFVIHHFSENQGRPYARQKGLELAQGEYIAMLDADDMYHPEKLSMQVKIMQDNVEVALVSSGMCSFGNSTNFISIRSKGDGNIHSYTKKNKLPVSHAPSILKRELAIKLSFNPLLKLGQDTDFLERYLDCKKYLILPNVLYYYSEYDSVSKKKILRAYKIVAKNDWNNKEYKRCVQNLLKMLYGIILFPFMSIEKILKKRGDRPSEIEIEEFEKYCKPYIIQKE